MNEREDDRESDSRECLSDSHKDFMERYIAAEMERQERVSDRFLKRCSHQREAKTQNSRSPVEIIKSPGDRPGSDLQWKLWKPVEIIRAIVLQCNTFGEVSKRIACKLLCELPNLEATGILRAGSV
jgi:hypothetical protein